MLFVIRDSTLTDAGRILETADFDCIVIRFFLLLLRVYIVNPFGVTVTKLPRDNFAQISATLFHSRLH